MKNKNMENKPNNMSKKQMNKNMEERLESIFRQWRTLNSAPNAKTAIRNLFKEAIHQARREALEKVFAELGSPIMHAEVIREVLGKGNHYSTMPVVAGIVHKLKLKLKYE